jgi:hypothetical protein
MARETKMHRSWEADFIGVISPNAVLGQFSNSRQSTSNPARPSGLLKLDVGNQTVIKTLEKAGRLIRVLERLSNVCSGCHGWAVGQTSGCIRD